jgi:hypothetical protein
MAHKIIASWLAGRRNSYSRTVRRCLLIQAKVRSTTHRRGRTSNACGVRRATIWMVIFNVAAQVVSLPV